MKTWVICYRDGSAKNWWLRSVNNANNFRYVNNNGNSNNNSANNSNGLVLGFGAQDEYGRKAKSTRRSG